MRWTGSTDGSQLVTFSEISFVLPSIVVDCLKTTIALCQLLTPLVVKRSKISVLLSRYETLRLVYTYRQQHVSETGTFDLSDVRCKQHYTTALNPFLNGMKDGDVDGMCK